MKAVLVGLIFSAAAVAELAQAAAPAEPVEAPAKPVEVMVLGTWHFANPGQDLNNIQAEDVLTKRRQAELTRIVDVLATFRPTKVMVEKVAKQPDLVDEAYGLYTTADLTKTRNERVQLGYRLAHQLGLTAVYAIDEQPGPQEPDYFPFDKVTAWAAANGKSGQLDAVMGKAADASKEFQAKQSRQTLAESLIGFNDAAGFQSRIDTYYGMLPFGDAEDQPGAQLNAMWYLRNAKIFAKLMSVSAPGDRVLVIYGAGHNYWLRHFAQYTPGYRNVDPIPYLRQAGSR